MTVLSYLIQMLLPALLGALLWLVLRPLRRRRRAAAGRLAGPWREGALLLLLGDLAARQLLSPVVLPIGAITSFLGAPLFLYMLFKGRDRL